jgi:hypothetical protein
VQPQAFERRLRGVLEGRGELAGDGVDRHFACDLQTHGRDARVSRFVFGNQVEHQRRGERVRVLGAEIDAPDQFLFKHRRLDVDAADLGRVRTRGGRGAEALGFERRRQAAGGFAEAGRPCARLQTLWQRQRRALQVGLGEPTGAERRLLGHVDFDVQAARRAGRRFVGFDRERWVEGQFLAAAQRWKRRFV